MRRLLATTLITACFAAGAAAQAVRATIPADAKEGKVGATTASQIEIDGKTYRLAPGARILSQRNLFVTPNMVPAGAQARYVLDAGGQVRNVWLVDPNASDRGPSTGPVERTPGTAGR